jgi:hypothetical protein
MEQQDFLLDGRSGKYGGNESQGEKQLAEYIYKNRKE